MCYSLIKNQEILNRSPSTERKMRMKFICYPKCTTCQKARKWLDDNEIEYELRDIKLDKPTLDELTEWYQKSGLPLKKFFNTSGFSELKKGLRNREDLPLNDRTD